MHRSRPLPRTLMSYGLAGLACLGILTTPAAAVLLCAWEDPCVDPLTCVFDYCWCEGDWGDSANWGAFCSGIPDTGSEIARITRSNGDPDGPDDNCDPWSDDCNEGFVQLDIGGEGHVVNSLEIVTDASTSALNVVIWGDAGVGCGAFSIDASEGPVVFEIGGGALVQTY